LISVVHHDAAHVKVLTKTDMIEFYQEFIHPSSPDRAKLEIHLNAQSPSPDISAVKEAANKEPEVLDANKDRKLPRENEVVSGVEGNGTAPFIITDVRTFKAMLQVSAELQPVKHISEFEDLD
jgi:insulysin